MTQDTGPAAFDAVPGGLAAGNPVPGSQPPGSQARGSQVAGTLIAGYQVEAEIGRGGMAVVYRALDVKLGRLVALKLLAPRIAEDESFRRRFIYESRAAAAVDHPHIVPVFEAGEADGSLFIAMRYVGTGDVRTLMERQGTLPVARAITIASQVASALDAAHARGLIHRDVKPANMLLADTAGGADHVYLSDFGLSKHALAPAALTSTGQFLGTLDYVAPEQIEGRPVDGRADLYALACTTVEMLTGAPPFRREENLALMWAQLSEPPPLLSQRRAELPPALDQVIGRALAKSPGDRYRTCTDFATALRTACAPQPRETPRPSEAAGRHEATALSDKVLGDRALGDRVLGDRAPSDRVVPGEATSPSAAPPLGAAAAGAAAVTPGTSGEPAMWPPTELAAAVPEQARPTALDSAGISSRVAPPPTDRPPAEPLPPRSQPGEPWPREPWLADPRSAGSPSADPRSAGSPWAGPRSAGFRPAGSRSAGPRSAEPRSADSRSAEPRSAAARPAAAWPEQPQSTGARQAGARQPGNQGNRRPARRPRGRRRGRTGLAVAATIIVVLGLAGLGYKLLSSPSSTASAPATTSASGPALATSPAQTVQAYFAAINRHQYARAWRLGGKNTGVSFGSFVSGFHGTAHDSVRILSARGAVVTAQLTATQTDGSVQTYQGTYTVSHGQIARSDIHRTD